MSQRCGAGLPARCFVSREQSLFIVSDGISSHRAGEVAARAVVTLLPFMIAQRQTPSTQRREQILRDAIVELSHRLQAASVGQASGQKMGATVAVVWMSASFAQNRQHWRVASSRLSLLFYVRCKDFGKSDHAFMDNDLYQQCLALEYERTGLQH